MLENRLKGLKVYKTAQEHDLIFLGCKETITKAKYKCVRSVKAPFSEKNITTHPKILNSQ